MNGSMIDTAFMINPLASDKSQAPSSGFDPEITEECSFLGCLLGVMSGGEEGDGCFGKIQFMSKGSEEIVWTSIENRLGCLLGNATAKENTQTGPHENALEEILGVLSDAGENEKQTDLLAALIKENTNENQAVVRGSWNGDPEGRANVLSTSKVVKTNVNGDLIASEVTMDDSQKPTLAEGIARGSSQGKAVVDEALFSQTMKDVANRLQGNHDKTALAGRLDRVVLSDSALPEGKGGTTHVMPAGEEMSHLQLTQPSALAEGVTTANRPVPALLADGLMEQVLQTLNLKTWKVGQRELRIQLHPPELGRLQMKIGLEEHQVVLKIHVENPFVKDLIENNLAQLRQTLQDQGLRMGKCAVTVSDYFQHELGRNDDHPEGFSGGHAGSVDEGQIEDSPSQRACSAYHWDSNLVNVFI